jgi:hypothetical protein
MFKGYLPPLLSSATPPARACKRTRQAIPIGCEPSPLLRPSRAAIGRLQDVINQCIQVINSDDVSLDRAVPLLVHPSSASIALLFQAAANAEQTKSEHRCGQPQDHTWCR